MSDAGPHPRSHHCRECCRWCFELSQIDMSSDWIIMPPVEYWANCASVREYAKLSLMLPEREFAFGHMTGRFRPAA